MERLFIEQLFIETERRIRFSGTELFVGRRLTSEG